MDFGNICDRLIHHFAFEARHVPENDRIEILFNSDHTSGRPDPARHRGSWSDGRLFLMQLDEYVALITEVAGDEVLWVDMNRAEGKVIQRRNRPQG